MDDSLSAKSFVELEQTSNLRLQKLFFNVMLVPRSKHGQLYILKGLAEKVHFTLGTRGVTKLTQFLDTASIEFKTIKGFRDDVIEDPSIHVESKSGKTGVATSGYLGDLLEKTEILGRKVIPHLLQVSISSSFKIKSYVSQINIYNNFFYRYQCQTQTVSIDASISV